MHRTLTSLVAAILIASALFGAHASTPAHAAAPRSMSFYGYADTFTATHPTANWDIWYYGRRWGVSYFWLLRVAECESGLNASAYNASGASGLFQFMPGTFYSYARQIGEWRSLWNPAAAANVAAYMFSRGQAYQWSCN